MNPLIKLVTEAAPLAAFFVGYKQHGLVSATLYLVVATIIALAVSYYFERKLNKMSVFSCLLVTIMGLITVYTGNSNFIKMKPTVIYVVISLILFIGIYFKKSFVKSLFNNLINMPEQAWLSLSFRCGVFFLSLAIANEIIWRNFPEEIWIKFKVFAILPVTILFMMAQIPYLNKHKI